MTVAVDSAGWHVAAFAEEYCRHRTGRWYGKPLRFEPWQREILDEMFALYPDGRRVYRKVLLGLPRKNGKSSLCAALALYLAGPDGEHSPQVILAAGSREQAKVVYDAARGFVEDSAALQDFYVAQAMSITCRDTNGVIRRIAADGRLQHGLNPHAVICDELHSLTSPRQEELWQALTTGSGAREEPLLVSITTAGYSKSTILGRLYDAALALGDVEQRDGLTIARDRESGFLMVWYAAPVAADLEDESAWMLANPASWITKSELRRQLRSPEMDENTFRRLHLNQWTAARAAWLRDGVWPSNRTDEEIPDGAEIYVGVDIGLTHDTTGVAWSMPSDGHTVNRVMTWSTRNDSVAHELVQGGRFNLSIAEDFIRRLAERYTVREVAFDPKFFERSAELLAADGLVCIPFDQASKQMAIAYQDFYVGANERRVHHNGDEVLAAHVASAKATMTDRGWRIDKIRPTQKIDGLVALVISNSRASRRAAMSIYATRGLVSV